MDQDYLYQEYFREGTRGYNILRRFYHKYYDLFVKTDYPALKEFADQIFLSLSQIDPRNIRKKEQDYIIGAIHIQCRSILDKAIKRKRANPGGVRTLTGDGNEIESLSNLQESQSPTPQQSFEAQEILTHLTFFKVTLGEVDKKILNALIDDMSREEIAHELKMKINTLDTRIRRLRIRLVEYLKKSGYNFSLFEKFSR